MHIRIRYALFPLLLGSLCAAQSQTDPYANPKQDTKNPMRYIPSDTLTGIFAGLLAVTTIGLTRNVWKHGAKYMLWMVVAAWLFTVGIACRALFARDPHSIPKFILQRLFILLSPCGFIAADYILLGRITRHLHAEQYLFISPNKVTVIFVCSDIFTFLMQSTGGGMSIGDSEKRRELGEKISIGGLVLQLLSFGFFTILFLTLLHRIHKNAPRIWRMDSQGPWTRDWRALAAALCISCVGVLIRSFYRTIEITQGWAGPLATSEPHFYALDVIPLFIAISIYIPFWPGKFISERNFTLARTSEEAGQFVPNVQISQVSQDGMELGHTPNQHGRGKLRR